MNRLKRKTFRRRCLNDNVLFHPWTDKGRFCSRACAAAFRKTAYAEALARRTTGLSATILRGQERARGYRESAEYAELRRSALSDLLLVESIVSTAEVTA